MDVAGLPDLQAADQVGVGGPGPLLAGGALIAPGVPDQLVGGLQDPAGAGQLGERLRVGGVQDEDAAVGGGRDPVPLILGRAQALPGLGADLDADAEGAAAFVQVGQRHPPGDRGVVIGGQQHRPRLRRAGLTAAWAASSVIAMACASATEGSLVPSRMKYQASASARVPGPSRAGPSRSSSVANRSWISGRCLAAAWTRATSAGWRPSDQAFFSHRASRRSRNPAPLTGGPAGAVTARVRTACMMSA